MRITDIATVLLTSGLAALLGACAEQPPLQAVPIRAEAKDLFVLEGDWWGQYWSADTGRSGRIRLSLTAEDDRAYGDVLMLPAVREGNLVSADRGEPATSETLAIEFVRIYPDTETVSGTLAPYRDPDCDCVVATTFTGRVSRDSIAGTFITQAGGTYGAKRGRWRVERQEAKEPD